jgi:hypothetical protein
MLGVITPSVVMLYLSARVSMLNADRMSVVMLNVVIQSFIMSSAVMLSVISMSAMAQSGGDKCHYAECLGIKCR